MAKAPRCQRCDKPSVFLTKVTIGLDDEHVQLALCNTCTRNCRADVHVWQMFGVPVTAPRPRLEPTRRPVFNSLPPAAPRPLNSARPNGHVQFPVIRREPIVLDDEPTTALIAPEILHGQDRVAVAQATDRWMLSKNTRARVLERDLDPLDVFLVADAPDKVIPGDTPAIEMRVGLGIKVIVSPETHTIIDAYAG